MAADGWLDGRGRAAVGGLAAVPQDGKGMGLLLVKSALPTDVGAPTRR